MFNERKNLRWLILLVALLVLPCFFGNVFAMAAQCNDGSDNDYDDYVDMKDSGCTSPEDNDELNPHNNGVLRVSTDNPRYFTDNSGEPIYLSGWNCWGNLQDGMDNAWSYDWGNPFYVSRGGYTGYIDDHVADNFNYVRLWMYESPKIEYDDDARPSWGDDFPTPMPWKRTGPGIAYDGKLKFDLTNLDNAYRAPQKESAAGPGKRGLCGGSSL